MSMTSALIEATRRLAATSETPRLDAELLMAHALGIGRDALLLGPDRTVPPSFAALVERRAAGEPVAYLAGTRDFWDMTLTVTPAVLIPRPDSETLIEAAIAHFAGRAGPVRILDLGTGSGALLLAALRVWPEARGVGIDRSPAALAIAAVNARALGLAHRAAMTEGGWAGTGETFDLILCNPPYIETGAVLPRDVRDHEPASALFAGADGLDDYRALIPLLPAQLAPGGVACLEIGADQADRVMALVADCGLAASLRRDLAGRDRCVVASA
jgi:release factor glutamine methyltransferase